MNFKNKLLVFSILFFSLNSSFAAEPAAVSYKLNGFVRNDFYINSRQNLQAQDGIFNILPRPIELNASGEDANAIPEAEMLSILSRIGLDLYGTSAFGAKTSARIECDFAGVSTTYFVMRLRQAYVKLNWSKTELLVGQTWHPMFGSVIPTVPSASTGSPFQPFNRSPQLRLKQNLTESLSLTGAAIYQMQYMSQGPNGSSVSYLKNAVLPNVFVGLESKTKKWTSGLGFDLKTIKIKHQYNTSASAQAYTQFVDKKLQIKAKATYGENLSDHMMIGGYGVSGKDTTRNEATFTNFNTFTSWLNVIYGSKMQVGIFAGITQNLGTTKNLILNSGKFTAYGYGLYDQQLTDRLYRIAPHVTYNLSNIRLGVEYELTSAKYGTIKTNGRVANPYSVNNHRAMATISYIF